MRLRCVWLPLCASLACAPPRVLDLHVDAPDGPGTELDVLVAMHRATTPRRAHVRSDGRWIAPTKRSARPIAMDVALVVDAAIADAETGVRLRTAVERFAAALRAEGRGVSVLTFAAEPRELDDVRDIRPALAPAPTHVALLEAVRDADRELGPLGVVVVVSALERGVADHDDIVDLGSLRDTLERSQREVVVVTLPDGSPGPPRDRRKARRVARALARAGRTRPHRVAAARGLPAALDTVRRRLPHGHAVQWIVPERAGEHRLVVRGLGRAARPTWAWWRGTVGDAAADGRPRHHLCRASWTTRGEHVFYSGPVPGG